MTKPRTRPGFFGEVLFDHFPDRSSVLGGAPFNVAFHLEGLGLAPRFISRIGDDTEGRRVLATMHRIGMDVDAVQIDPDHPTGRVEVTLPGGEPRFEIVEGAAWDFIDADLLPVPRELALLYHGSLALRSAASRASFEETYAAADLPIFLDVNLRAPWYDLDHVRQLMAGATWLKLNDVELDLIAPGDAPQLERARQLLDDANLDLVVLTRGAKGAVALAKSGETAEVVPAQATTVVDTVGAGDAFAAVILTGLLQGWQTADTLDRAQQLAGLICGQRGATPDDPGFYEPLREAWDLP